MIKNFKLKIKNCPTGFTLIELMVAVTVSLVVMTGLAISVSGYFSNEKVSRAASELSSMINFARSMAITSQVTAGFTKLDYVAVTLSESGVVSAFPVNNISGSGPSFFAKDIAPTEVVVSPLKFGDLQFAAGSGKLVGKDLSPLFSSYPQAPNFKVGVSLTSLEGTGVKNIEIGALGTVKVN